MTTQPLPDALLDASILKNHPVWHGDAPRCLPLEDHSPLFAMAPDQTRLIAGGKKLHVWSVQARRVVMVLKNPLFYTHYSARQRLAWIRDGAAVLMDNGEALGVCAVAPGAHVTAVPFKRPKRYTLSWDGRWMACSTELGSFQVVDTEGWEVRWETPVPLTYAHAVSFDARGARLAMLRRGALEVWQVGEDALLLRVDTPHDAQHMVLSHDGACVFYEADGQVVAWDVSSRARMWSQPLGALLGAAAFTRDDAHIWAVAEQDDSGARAVCLDARSGARVSARPFHTVRVGEAPERAAPPLLFPEADLVFDGFDTSRTGVLLTLQRLTSGAPYPSPHDQRARSSRAARALAWVSDDEALRVQRDGSIARLSQGGVVQAVGPVLAPLADRPYQDVTLRISPDRSRFALVLHYARRLMVGDVRTLEAEPVATDAVGYGISASFHDLVWFPDSARVMTVNLASDRFTDRQTTYFKAIDVDQPDVYLTAPHLPYSAPAHLGRVVHHPEGGLIAVGSSQALIMREGSSPQQLHFDTKARRLVAASGESMRAVLGSGAVVCLKTGAFVCQLEGCEKGLGGGVMTARGALLVACERGRAPRLRVWATDDGRLVGELDLPQADYTLFAERLVAHAKDRVSVVRLAGLERLLSGGDASHADARVHRALETLRGLVHRVSKSDYGRALRWESVVDLLSRWPGPVDIAVDYLRAHDVGGPMPKAWLEVLCAGRDVPAVAAVTVLERRGAGLIGAKRDSAWVKLLASKHLTGLTKLTLSGGPEVLDALARAQLPSLKMLGLTMTGFGSAHGARLRDSAWLRGLRGLVLAPHLGQHDADFDDGLRALAQTPFTALQGLTLNHVSAPSMAAFFEEARALDTVTYLGLGAHAGDCAFLARCADLAAVRLLRVGLSAAPGAPLAYLRAPHFTALEHIVFTEGTLSRRHAEALGEAACAGTLQTLAVSLGDASAAALAALRLPTLAKLTVHDHVLETADIRALTDSPHLGALKTLRATVSKRVRPKRLEALRARYPGLALEKP